MASQEQAADGLIPVWSVGDRLRKAREMARIGVTEMAERLGRERNTISRWERSPVAQTMVIRLYSIETGVSAEWIEHGGVQPSGGLVELQDRRSRNRSEEGVHVSRCTPPLTLVAA